MQYGTIVHPQQKDFLLLFSAVGERMEEPEGGVKKGISLE